MKNADLMKRKNFETKAIFHEILPENSNVDDKNVSPLKIVILPKIMIFEESLPKLTSIFVFIVEHNPISKFFLKIFEFSRKANKNVHSLDEMVICFIRAINLNSRHHSHPDGVRRRQAT